MVSDRCNAVLPEWEGFAHAVRSRRPDSGTWCEGWTVRDVLIHQTGNAAELHRVLGAHLSGRPVATRSFEERERPYRLMTDASLWSAFVQECERLADLSESATTELEPASEIRWTGRSVTPAFFAEHLRSELVLHRWDLTGDDATTDTALAQPWMTTHSVRDVGRPLLARGSGSLRLDPGERVEGRLRSPGSLDVLVTATPESATVELVPAEGAATIESDSAVRALFLWGRRPADPSRWFSQAGPDALRRVRTLLSGY